MWEVDPETKSKLLVLQKQAPNGICADCSSPSPQWASPKFGTFICLDCAGIHRGLGVHVSFVRSVMMDSFKVSEVRRMEEGGNKAWRDFWDNHAEGGKAAGAKTGWESVQPERYDGPVGEEYKERLACKVEGREFVPLPKKEPVRKTASQTSAAGIAGSASGSARSASNTPSRTGSPAVMGGRKTQNEAYFAQKGAENANRPADLPPSQGGKYAGFGSSFTPDAQQQHPAGGQDALPGVDDFQKDPVAALTKGFGWFTTAVTKQAKTVNEGWLQPNMQKLAESDLAAQARQTAASVAANVAKGAQGAASTVGQGINKFVEGDDAHYNASSGRDTGTGTAKVAPEHKDFWDSFGDAGGNTDPGSSIGIGAKKTSSVGTAAMKSGSSSSGPSGPAEHKEDWGKDDW